MSRILLLYSTTDGHTRSICDRISEWLGEAGHEASIVCLDDDPDVDLDGYDKIVLGASIRYGKHSKAAYGFVKARKAMLDARPSAFFSVNVVARKPEKNRPETNPYLQKFLRQIEWVPARLDVFAGRLDYPSYGFFDRTMIRFIMWMTKGPTAPDTVVEFTDWDRVKAFAQAVAEM